MDELSPTALALTAMPDGVVLFDRRHHVSFLNRAATDLLGVDVDQYLGTPWPEVRDALGLSEPGSAQGELIDYNGRRLNVRPLALPPEAARNGLSRGLLLTAQTEEARQIVDLASTFSHEARVPLTVIGGYSDMLLRGLVGPLNEDQLEFVRSIRERNTDVIHIVNQAIALLEILTSEQASEEIDVVGLAAEAVSRAQHWHRGRAIRCEVSSAAEPLLAHTSEPLIRGILWQLVDNAFRYTPPGGAVTISLRGNGGSVQIEVSDGGPGIPADVHARFLEGDGWAVRTPAGSRRGPGLGLTIIRASLRRVGGTLTLADAAGGGCCFVVSVPAAAEG